MILLLKILSLTYAGIGVLFALKPDHFRKYIMFWRREKMLRWGSLAAFFLGIFLLSYAAQCQMPAFSYVLGTLCLVKSVLLFVLGAERINKIFDWWETQPARVLRMAGLLVVAVGLAWFSSI